MTNPTTFDYDLFISYNQHDAAWAEQLATRLEQEDYQERKLKVFFAPWDIKPGESIPERLEYALPRSRKVCLIMSPESAASEWVKVERYVTHHIDIAERQLRLIPLYRRASEIPPFLQHINRIDFQDDAKFEMAIAFCWRRSKTSRCREANKKQMIQLPPLRPVCTFPIF